MWQMLRVYGVGRKLSKAVQSFCVDSSHYRQCVQIRMDVSELFPVNVKLRKEYVISLVFNLYIYGVVLPLVN